MKRRSLIQRRSNWHPKNQFSGKHTAADVVAKAQALSEAELSRAMFDVGYFPPNTPPGSAAVVIGPKADIRLQRNNGR
jgi:hypothetical protein